MGKFSKFIAKINQPLNSSNFIELLGIIFWILLICGILSFGWLAKNLDLNPSIQGFNNIFEIFKFPLTLIASSIAILTLRVTFTRVLQTDKQLESSYKPELYIDKGELYFFSRKDGEYANRFIFTTSGMFNELPQLSIYNVGFAVAKEIKHHFECDVVEALRLLKRLNNKDEFNIEYLNDSLVIRSTKTNYRGTNNLVSVQNRERVFNFLLPASTNNITYKINLPLYYCDLLALFLYLELNARIKEKEGKIPKRDIKLTDFPPLKIIISYKDLGDKILEKKFEIRFIVPFFFLPIVNETIVDRDNKFLIESKAITP